MNYCILESLKNREKIIVLKVILLCNEKMGFGPVFLVKIKNTPRKSFEVDFFGGLII